MLPRVIRQNWPWQDVVVILMLRLHSRDATAPAEHLPDLVVGRRRVHGCLRHKQQLINPERCEECHNNNNRALTTNSQSDTEYRDERGLSVSEEHCADTTAAKRKRGKYFVLSGTGFCGNANVTLRGEPSASLALNRFPGRWGVRGGGAVKVSWLSPVHSWTCADQLTHCCCHCCRVTHFHFWIRETHDTQFEYLS